jgi:WD40 repeat protein
MLEINAVEAWSIDISPDDKLLAAGTQSGNVNLWDMTTKDKVLIVIIHYIYILVVISATAVSHV